MPRVLRIINRFNLGGITYNVSYLTKYLAPAYETLLVGGPEEDSEESSLYIPEELGIRPLVIKELRRSINPLNDLRAFFRIRKIIREFKPQLVHTHASKAGAIGRLAAFSCKVPVVVHTFHGHVFHGYFGKSKTAVIKTIERFLGNRSSRIVAISNKQKSELSADHGIVRPDKITVIPLGFDLKRFQENRAEKRTSFRKKFQIAENELAIVIIGRLAPIKNHFLFIDAIEFVLQNSKKKIRAFIIGDGEMRDALSKYLASKKLSFGMSSAEHALITFTGWIKEADVALAGSDLVCLSSLNEGTPVSLIEAQAASKFIISTRVGGIEDILHPHCGLLADVDDVTRYKENLLYAVEHFEEVNAKAGAASEEVRERFSYARLCTDMANLYKELLEGKD